MEERVRKSNIHLTKSQRKRQNEGAKAIFEETMRMFHNWWKILTHRFKNSWVQNKYTPTHMLRSSTWPGKTSQVGFSRLYENDRSPKSMEGYLE